MPQFFSIRNLSFHLPSSIFGLLFLLPQFSFSQSLIQYTNKIYNGNIRTFQITVPPLYTSNPVIILGGQNYFRFSFDDLEGGNKNYYYTVELCNADWSHADVDPFEYIDGFSEQQIYDYKNSFNTDQVFTHYTDSFPRKDFNLKLSGNYLLKIYLDNDPTKIVITQRFLIYEPKLSITSRIHQPVDLNINETSHEVDCTVKTTGTTISNPWDDVKLTIMQNFRWDNTISLKPLFVKNDELDYNYQEENIFTAGKEFRMFDTRTLRYKGYHVFDLKESVPNGLPEVYLYADDPRTYQKYYFEKDLNGKFIIDKQETTSDANLEADYCYVNFTMPMSIPLTGGKMYVFGALSNWDTIPEMQMKYNDKIKAYECWAKLKQGYYNYQYIFVDDKLKTFDCETIEGNWWETEDDYQILVYYRPPGARYDQLIGFKQTNSTIQ